MGEVYLSIRRGSRSKDQHLGSKLLQVKRPLVAVGERGAAEGELPADSCAAQIHHALCREPLVAAQVMLDNEAVAVQRVSVRVGNGRTRAVKVAADVRSAQVDLALRREWLDVFVRTLGAAEQVLAHGQPGCNERPPAGVAESGAIEIEPPADPRRWESDLPTSSKASAAEHDLVNDQPIRYQGASTMIVEGRTLKAEQSPNVTAEHDPAIGD